MIDTESLIAETAAKIFADHCGREVPHEAEAGKYPQTLWDILQENGLTRAWVSEENGGFGAEYSDVFGAIWASAKAASPVPFAETLIAGWLLDRAEALVPEGALSFAIFDGNRSAPVPFADVADHIVTFDCKTGQVELFQTPEHSGEQVPNLSPDGGYIADFSELSPLTQSASNLTNRGVEALVLTVRATQMAASMEAALDLSLEYVLARQQFGRPLAKFQAVQQQLAQVASEVAAATMAATQAASSFAQYREAPEKAWHEAVIAKIQIGHSVEAVTAPCHQVHGAMGYTQEYGLHHYTRRLWAWRDALGNEHHWSKLLGAELAAASVDDIWKGVTSGEWQSI